MSDNLTVREALEMLIAMARETQERYPDEEAPHFLEGPLQVAEAVCREEEAG